MGCRTSYRATAASHEHRYKKSGVLLMGLQPRTTIQAGLFTGLETQTRSAELHHKLAGVGKGETREIPSKNLIPVLGISYH